MTTPIRVTGNDEGVALNIEFIPHGLEKDLQALTIDLKTPERCKQLQYILQRGLNTCDPEEMPEWLVGLMDFITGTPTQPSKKLNERRVAA